MSEAPGGGGVIYLSLLGKSRDGGAEDFREGVCGELSGNLGGGGLNILLSRGRNDPPSHFAGTKRTQWRMLVRNTIRGQLQSIQNKWET